MSWQAGKTDFKWEDGKGNVYHTQSDFLISGWNNAGITLKYYGIQETTGRKDAGEMKVLVTGAWGQLGSDVMQELERQGLDAAGVDISEMDITDAAAVDAVLAASGADAVIHCAAYTAVDAAEENEELCRSVNRDGTQNIASACRKLGMKLLYLSTDYVFDGTGERPWEPEDERNPLNVYGRTKYEGELAVQSTLKEFLSCGFPGFSVCTGKIL